MVKECIRSAEKNRNIRDEDNELPLGGITLSFGANHVQINLSTSSCLHEFGNMPQKSELKALKLTELQYDILSITLKSEAKLTTVLFQVMLKIYSVSIYPPDFEKSLGPAVSNGSYRSEEMLG